MTLKWVNLKILYNKNLSDQNPDCKRDMKGVNDTDEVQSTIDKKKNRIKKGVEVEPIE